MSSEFNERFRTLMIHIQYYNEAAITVKLVYGNMCI